MPIPCVLPAKPFLATEDANVEPVKLDPPKRLAVDKK
jgi:hypothetical protein